MIIANHKTVYQSPILCHSSISMYQRTWIIYKVREIMSTTIYRSLSSIKIKQVQVELVYSHRLTLFKTLHFTFVTIYDDDLLVTVAKQCFAYFTDGSAFKHVSRLPCLGEILSDMQNSCLLILNIPGEAIKKLL